MKHKYLVGKDHHSGAAPPFRHERMFCIFIFAYTASEPSTVPFFFKLNTSNISPNPLWIWKCRPNPTEFAVISSSSIYTVFYKTIMYIRLYPRISWSIFIILLPVETGLHTPQPHLICLLNCLSAMWSSVK